MEITLYAQPPFSLEAVMKSHGWIRLPPFRADEIGVGFTYIDRLRSGKVVKLHISEVQEGVVVSTETNLDKDERTEVVEKITWMLELVQDLREFYILARQEPKLKQVQERREGRILRSPTIFEDVVKTILTTNTVWAATIRMCQNLVSQFGSAWEPDENLHAFPTPEQLARTDETTLRAQTRLGYRAPYVLELARRVASGELNLEGYKYSDLDTHELRKRLLGIKGVGDYAAANLLMLLGRYDYIPVDTWALKVVAHEWYNDQPIGKAEVERAFEHWGKWKGLAFNFWDWSYSG